MKISNFMYTKIIIRVCVLVIAMGVICIGCGEKPKATATPTSTIVVNNRTYKILNIEIEKCGTEPDSSGSMNLKYITKPFDLAIAPGFAKVSLVEPGRSRPAGKEANYHSIKMEITTVRPEILSHDNVGSHPLNKVTNQSVLRPCAIDMHYDDPQEGVKSLDFKNMAKADVALHELLHFFQKDHIEKVGSIMRDNLTSHESLFDASVIDKSGIPTIIDPSIVAKIKAALLVSPQPCPACGQSAHFKPFVNTPSDKANCLYCKITTCQHGAHAPGACKEPLCTCGK
jgi:hypothetical protein